MKRVIENYLSRDEIGRIVAAIAAAEAKSSGEIRVSIVHRRRWRDRKRSLHELALREFRRLGMHKTRERTGVLIFLLLAERRFQIIADEGIHAKVAGDLWDRLAAVTAEHFGRGRFADGIVAFVEAVGAELALLAPRRPGDTNELPDQVTERP